MTANGAWGFDFSASRNPGDEFNHTVPFRKEPRAIKEVVTGFLWADAADFGSYGGWSLDTQHVGFMGSSYLIAPGTSKTVSDATLKLKKLKPGNYRLWVRSRNWIPEHAPGQFGIAINGNDSGHTFGAQKESGWTWQDGGVHELAGATKLALQDKTGIFGRCSSIIVTRDLNYQPPVEMDAFCAERAHLSGVSQAIRDGGEFDVIVVGGGPSGGPAALAAARLGARVALVSNRPVLGGNASAEIGVPVQGAAQKHRGKPVRETGIIEEAGRLALHEMSEHGLTKQLWSINMSRPFATMVEEEPNLTLLENVWLEGVTKEGSAIRSVVLRDTLTGARTRLGGTQFIDCTGDAWLGYHAGADSRRGREAFSEYKEEGAPEVADDKTMSGCLRGGRSDLRKCFFHACKQHDAPQSYTPPAWLYDLPAEWVNDRSGGGTLEAQHTRLRNWALQGTWWYEHPGEVDDLWDPEFARDELIRVNYTLWDYFKNHWPERDRMANYSLGYVPFMVGKRESRRLMGDHVLTANDAIANRQFEDVIAHTGWSLDVHHDKGILSTEGPFTIDTKIDIGQIPYRSLYSRNVDNLFMAGRCASVTHLALGTVRIEATCAVTGQVTGTAAALALHRKTSPRGIYQQHMSELQQLLLKNDVYVPGIRNLDTADIARSAQVRASSERSVSGVSNGKGERMLPLSVSRGECFSWQAGERLQTVKVYLESTSAAQVTLHLRGSQKANDFTSTTNLAKVTQRVPAGTKGWVEIPIDAVIDAPYGWITLSPSGAVQWRSGESTRPGSSRLYGQDPKWTLVSGSSMAVQLEPDLGIKALWSPENVINGIARPTLDGADNCWESDSAQDFPQWMGLQLPRATKVGAVHCVFDTDLTLSMPSQRRDRLPEVIIRDYTVECFVDGQWKAVARVRDNFQRFRRHNFVQVTTDRIRITVEATRGAKNARIFEVRAYPHGAPLLMS